MIPEHSPCMDCGSNDAYYLGPHWFNKNAQMWVCKHCGALWQEERFHGGRK